MTVPLLLLASLATLPLQEPSSEDRRVINLPIRFVQFADDDGTADIYKEMNHPLSSEEVARIVDDINARVYDRIGIHFVFDKSRRVPIVRNSRLFRCTDPNVRFFINNQNSKPPQLDENATYLPFALDGQGLLVVARRGIMWRWNDKRGVWYSSPDASRGHSEFIAVNATWSWAHEIGHLFGLPHSFAVEGLTNVQMIQERIDAYKAQHIGRDPLEAIDGDWKVGVKDTPPDPGSHYWRGGVYEDRVNLLLSGDQPTEVYMNKRNLMGYTGGMNVSPDQAELMRATARFWEMAGGSFPLNVVPKRCQVFRATRESLVAPRGVAIREGRQRNSYGGQSFFEASLPIGSTISFSFRPEPGKYQVWFIGTRGLDHATCELSVNGTAPESIDFWSSGGLEGSLVRSRLPSGRIALGQVQVESSPVVLKVKATGKSRMSFGTTVGIEGVIVQKME